jgi:hypothetical protein
MQGYDRQRLTKRMQELTEERAEYERALSGSYDSFPTARNATMRDTRQSLITKKLGTEGKMNQVRVLLSLLDVLDELNEHPRVARAQLTHLWLIQKPGQDAMMSTKNVRVDLVLTDQSRHCVSIADGRVSAEDIRACIFEALEET